MNISAKEICFEPTSTQHSLQISSASNSTVIFKIKITNTELFTIMPGKGFLKPNSRLQIQIKTNRLAEISAKLLVSYCVLADDVETGNGFDKIWNGLSKDLITNEIIPITRESVRQKAEVYKKTDSPVYQAELEAQSAAELQSKKQPNVSQLMGSMKSSSVVFKSVKDFDRCNSLGNNSNLQTVSSLHFEKQLQRQRQKCRKMKGQLQERQRKMEYYRDMNQQHINKSLKNQVRVEGIYCANIVLMVFVCLLVGFFAAKVKLPEGWTV